MDEQEKPGTIENSRLVTSAIQIQNELIYSAFAKSEEGESAPDDFERAKTVILFSNELLSAVSFHGRELPNLRRMSLPRIPDDEIAREMITGILLKQGGREVSVPKEHLTREDIESINYKETRIPGVFIMETKYQTGSINDELVGEKYFS